jgi:hypothetical protein
MFAATENLCHPSIRLVHLPRERVWVFKEGTKTVNIGTIQTEWETRAEAVRDAERVGLRIDRYGCVKVVSKPAWIR